jgi:hypothetical protein
MVTELKWPNFWQENFQDEPKLLVLLERLNTGFLSSSRPHELTFSPHSSILDWYGASRQQNPGIFVTIFDCSPLAKEHTCPMVVLFPNTRATELSKRSLVFRNCALSCVLHASVSKGGSVGDAVGFHADMLVSLNPKGITISAGSFVASPIWYVSRYLPALSISITFAHDRRLDSCPTLLKMVTFFTTTSACKSTSHQES